MSKRDANILTTRMCAHMPKIRRLECHAHFNAELLLSVDEIATSDLEAVQHKSDISRNIRALFKGAIESSDGLTCSTRVFVHSPLISMSRTYRLTEADRQTWPRLTEDTDWSVIADCFGDDEFNSVVYEARPTDDEGSWWGLNLEVAEGNGTYCFEAEASGVEKLLALEANGDSNDEQHDWTMPVD